MFMCVHSLALALEYVNDDIYTRIAFAHIVEDLGVVHLRHSSG